MLQAFGSTLKKLDLHVDTKEALEGVLGRTQFTLAPCTRLRTFALGLDLPDMRVPENRNLPWAATLVAQLSAPGIEVIMLAVRKNDMTWAPRVQFGDLRALDWGALDRALAGDRFAGLKRFVLEGRGDSDGSVLASFIENSMSGISSRCSRCSIDDHCRVCTDACVVLKFWTLILHF
ncbi:hypothetical protein AcV7_004482 [Taiwanofungus camphoratus]|nr:hypothetical protein AcV7_004482 [Antrodia cinnamomea]